MAVQEMSRATMLAKPSHCGASFAINPHASASAAAPAIAIKLKATFSAMDSDLAGMMTLPAARAGAAARTAGRRLSVKVGSSCRRAGAGIERRTACVWGRSKLRV